MISLGQKSLQGPIKDQSLKHVSKISISHLTVHVQINWDP